MHIIQIANIVKYLNYGIIQLAIMANNLSNKSETNTRFTYTTIFIICVFVIIFSSLILSACSKDNEEDIYCPPYNLQINLSSSPLSIDKENIRFSWAMSSNEIDDYQTAYRIKVFSSYKNCSKQKTLIDTKWIESNKSVGVTIEELNKKLNDNSGYYWQVATKNKFGVESSFSSPQFFSTAVGEKWTSTKGIWASDQNAQKSPNDFCFIRGNFDVHFLDLIDKVVLSATALSPEKTRQYVYNLYINDNYVGMGPSRIGRTQSGQQLLYYNSFDITNYINNGTNILGAVLYTLQEKAFLVQITAYYKNGNHKVLLNSGANPSKFSSLEADTIFQKDNSIGTGYYVAHANNIDATKYPFSFSSSSFDDSNWNRVAIDNNIDTSYVLTPYYGEHVGRYIIDQSNISISKIGENYLIDLGQEIIGGFGLDITSPTDTTIQLKYGEQLNTDGTVKYIMNTHNCYLSTWHLKTGYQHIETYDMMAYRYIEISGIDYDLTKESILGISYHTQFLEDDFSFSSNDDLLNSIYMLLKNTAIYTTQDLLVDSQSRERAPYEGDAFINQILLSLFSNHDYVSRFTLEYLFKKPTWPAEYILLSSKMALYDYYETGDVSLLEEYYNLLKTKLYFEYFDEDVNLSTHGPLPASGYNEYLYDWPETERDDYDTSVYYNTIF